jgi:glycerate kinase
VFGPGSLQDAIAGAPELLRASAEQMARLWQSAAGARR